LPKAVGKAEVFEEQIIKRKEVFMQVKVFGECSKDEFIALMRKKYPDQEPRSIELWVNLMYEIARMEREFINRNKSFKA